MPIHKMNLPDKNTSWWRLLLVSLICGLFIIYPNIACFSFDITHFYSDIKTVFISFSVFRFLFFAFLIWILLIINLRRIETNTFGKRLLYTFIISALAYLFYVAVFFLANFKGDCFTGLLLFQFLVTGLICAFTGHIVVLTAEQRNKEQEIEQLRVENLQSRCDALTNQINPHFFFNSLNGLTSLIRKQDGDTAIEYINKLSDLFRYVLQSDKKGIVTLEEELEVVNAFSYMMQVRFANKLVFITDVAPEKRNLKLPVLSLLPLIDNVVIHNIIDSEHKMEVKIGLSDNNELIVSNRIFPKLSAPDTNGTGLVNLDNRFQLLMNRQIRIIDDGINFTVYLPLLEDRDENTDS